MKIRLYNTIDGLKPCYDEDYEEKKKLKINSYYEAEIKEIRDYDSLRKYFKMLRITFDMLQEKHRAFFGNIETYRTTLQMEAGYKSLVPSLSKREWVEVPKSIAFDKMDEVEFKELRQKVLDIILMYLLKDITQQQLEEIIKNF